MTCPVRMRSATPATCNDTPAGSATGTYTVRPPADTDDPIGYLLGMAAEFGVEVIVVFDLGHVDSQPSSVCDKGFDLETVCPQGTWTRSAQPGPDVDAGAA